MKLKLTNPTPDQIDAAVAEHVAGWKYITATNSHVGPSARIAKRLFVDAAGMCLPVPRFSRSADAVLPLLEKWPDVEIHRIKANGWQVSIMDVRRYPDREETGVLAEAWEDTLARAACIALLRAHGVEVEFTQ